MEVLVLAGHFKTLPAGSTNRKHEVNGDKLVSLI
jgi:hypothetical protein